MNRVKITDEGETKFPFVHFVAFSSNGNWMATVDGLKNPSLKCNMYLKFWSFDKKTQAYSLNTQINHPHMDKITSICMKTTRGKNYAITTCLTGPYKIWELHDSVPGRLSSIYWFCKSSIDYMDHGSNYALFSKDASIYVVAHSGVYFILCFF